LSTTTSPGGPQLTATFAWGIVTHQRNIWRGSAVASFRPWGVAGTFWPGLQGKTCQPFAT